MDAQKWLYEAKVARVAPPSAYIFRVGLLALFPTIMPNAQSWVSSIIRQYMTEDKAVLDKAIQRCIDVLRNPDQRYWIKGIVYDNIEEPGPMIDIVLECSPFTPGAFPADDRESAELLVVTKLV